MNFKTSVSIKKSHWVCSILLFVFLLFSCTAKTEQYSLEGKSWEDVVADARDSTVHWYMWGGSDVINKFVEESIGARLQEDYGITLTINPVSDIALIVARIEAEVSAATSHSGSADLLWINGENFKTLKKQELLFGPYLDFLPNAQYIEKDASMFQYDFGYPTEGYESPYGAAQFVLVYDKARISEPPRTIEALLEWIRENPGRFTYPALPDFTGSAFVRHIVYHAAGGHDQLQGPYNEAVYEEVSDRAFGILEDIEQYLWQEGEFYPTSLLQLNELFANGVVDMSMTYQANDVGVLIEEGQFPATAQAYVLESGTIGNVHFVGIPRNAPNIPGALVAANLILDPAVQLEKLENWGDHSIISYDRLSETWKDRFSAISAHPSSVSQDALERVRIPEIGADWVVAIEEDWKKKILPNP